MENSINPVEHLRGLRLAGDNIEYGEFPTVTLSPTPPASMGIGVFVLVGIFSLIGSLAFNKGFWVSIGHAISWGFMAAIAYLSLPVLFFFVWLIRRIKNPDAVFINKLSSSQKWLTCSAISFVITTGIDIAVLKIFKWWHSTHPHFHYTAHQIIVGKEFVGGFSVSQFLGVWVLVLIVVGFFLAILFGSQMAPPQVRRHIKNKKHMKSPKIDSEPPFGLWVGESTGWLSSLYHGAGIAPEQQITLGIEDAAQNILILGAIGSGKTTCAMHPLLMQLIDQDCGGLIFDIKGDFQNAVLSIAGDLNREIIIIGGNHNTMNLLAGLTPEVASSFLKSIFTLNSPYQNDTFWLDTAVELCRNTLGILSFVPEHYSLNGLYSYLFDLETRIAIDDKITQQQLKLGR